MSDETTPGITEQIERILHDAYGCPPSSCAYQITDVVEAALDAKDAEIKELLAQLPSDGKGRWRQGTKNPRNLYVHQGDDEIGQPVGQLYSAELAALVCDAVNAQQARGEA